MPATRNVDHFLVKHRIEFVFLKPKDVSKKQTGFPSHDIFPNMSSVHRQQPRTFLLEFHQL